MMVVGVGQLDYGLGKCGEACGDGWGRGTIMTYAKFYVNPPRSQPLPRQKEQVAVRPSLPKALEGHTISRRSAADGGADAPSTHHEDGERTASTLINASHQLSGGCRAVVRAECTAARLLARWYGSRGSRSSRCIRRQQAVGPGSADGVRDDSASFPMRSGERGT